MSEKRTHTDYLQKAALYDLLGQFYKYSNPNLHMQYYWKHLKYMKKANQSMRLNSSLLLEEAKVKILHTSPDAPNIDVYINSKKIVKDLPFKNASNIFSLKTGKYHLDIYPTGNMTDSFLNKIITVEPRKSYTLAAIGHAKKMRLLSYINQPEVPLNEAKVRFIHLSPDTQEIEIAVKDRDVIFPNVAYKQSTNYLGLSPMTVDLETRIAESKEVILPMPKFHFKANTVYTIIFAGLTKEKPELQAIILTD
ncbi:MAG TPA: DUF4397 domain-containing protein [Neobacillus sp.]|jgi:hypothetical protein